MLTSLGCCTYSRLRFRVWLSPSEIALRIKDPTDARHSLLGHGTIRLDSPPFVILTTSTDQLLCQGYNLWLLQTPCLCTRRATRTGHLQHTNLQMIMLRSKCDWAGKVKIVAEGCRSKRWCTCDMVLFQEIFSLAIFSARWKYLFQTILYLLLQET
jgi:hypothetical protein